MERHAAATTGLLAAEGDNASGIAGVSWRTGLHLYAGYSSPGNHPLPIIDNFFVLAERIVQDQLRVLSLSADAAVDSTRPVADRDREIHLLADDIQHDLLDRLPDLLVVVAAGNHRYRGTAAGYVQNNKAEVIRAAMMLVRSDPAYRDRIILVTGTMQNNRFWDTWVLNPAQGSNFFTGATDVAAPAQDVTVLERWTGQTGSAVPLRVATGTSLSAPLVAGTAGLLLTADPTLTAAQLKDYIQRRAQQPRWNPGTQQLETPQQLTGAPETVYQADAYSALTLHARERSGAPLCGNRVWVAGTQLVAQRDPAAAPQVLAELGERAAFVNAHHGGRRVDVWNDNFVQRSFVYGQVAWTESTNPPVSPDGGAWNSLWSLSHDGDSAVTVQTTGTNGSQVEVRRGPSGGPYSHLADITTPLTTSGSFTCVWLAGSSGACNDSAFTGTLETAFWEAAAYSPIGDRVIVSITKARRQSTNVSGFSTCPWSVGSSQPDQCRSVDYLYQVIETSYHEVVLAGGAQRVLATAPIQDFWAALAEDGGQLVTGEGAVSQTSSYRPRDVGVGFVTVGGPQVITQCTLRYRQASTGLTAVFETATVDVCRGPLGGGSASPAPPISSRSR